MLLRVLRRVLKSRPIQWVYSDHVLGIFSLDCRAAECAPHPDVHRNVERDLDQFEQTERWLTRAAFLQEARHRIDQGVWCYSCANGGRLEHYCWVNPCQDSAWFPFVSQRYDFPPRSTVLYNAYTHPAARGKGLYRKVLETICADARDVTGAQHVFAAVENGNVVSENALRAVGFRCVDRLRRRMRFGRVTLSRLSC
ncbi:GNAT family N-acetyltransferase [Nitrogeniibacter mangrovi]|uniref:GNAT family N-acetyltransferase n=1 Tax=Nitrogeniibacter mangrovi TaxID=2016596 RepID=A0A6C1B4Y2_9RHOO|nr:GNAT family N-acetyltransferase [Nitrogeniibacter mangrovi]QID18537.1 GNAT family N-acetyltransferase [Nitrogeniibacter mangrovi]